MKICITGGAGFIGSNLAAALLSKGFDVCVSDDMSAGTLDNLKPIMEKISFEKISLSEKPKLAKFFENADMVMHLAAKTSPVESHKNPEKFLEVNVEGTQNVIGACRDSGAAKLVFASSAAVYAEISRPLKENSTTRPNNVYGKSKLAAENLIKTNCPDHGIGYCILRLFNVYGPMQNFRGEYAPVIPKFIAAALRNEPMDIRGDGRQVRDFIFIDDVVKAFARSAVSEACLGKTINIGSGKETRIINLAEDIKRITKSKSELRFIPATNGEVLYSCADTGLYSKLTGVKNFTSLETGMGKTAEWVRGKL